MPHAGQLHIVERDKPVEFKVFRSALAGCPVPSELIIGPVEVKHPLFADDRVVEAGGDGVAGIGPKSTASTLSPRETSGVNRVIGNPVSSW